MDAVGEDLEDRYGVINVRNVGADSEPGGELAPLESSCIFDVDAGVQHPMCHVRAHITVAMCHIVASDGWHSCQDFS